MENFSQELTDLVDAAKALETALRDYVNTGFSGLAFHHVTVCRERVRDAIAVIEA